MDLSSSSLQVALSSYTKMFTILSFSLLNERIMAMSVPKLTRFYKAKRLVLEDYQNNGLHLVRCWTRKVALCPSIYERFCVCKIPSAFLPQSLSHHIALKTVIHFVCVWFLRYANIHLNPHLSIYRPCDLGQVTWCH